MHKLIKLYLDFLVKQFANLHINITLIKRRLLPTNPSLNAKPAHLIDSPPPRRPRSLAQRNTEHAGLFGKAEDRIKREAFIAKVSHNWQFSFLQMPAKTSQHLSFTLFIVITMVLLCSSRSIVFSLLLRCAHT